MNIIKSGRTVALQQLANCPYCQCVFDYRVSEVPAWSPASPCVKCPHCELSFRIPWDAIVWDEVSSARLNSGRLEYRPIGTDTFLLAPMALITAAGIRPPLDEITPGAVAVCAAQHFFNHPEDANYPIAMEVRLGEETKLVSTVIVPPSAP